MRRSVLLVPLALILVAGAVFWWWTRPLPVLTIVTWPGTYGRAQEAAQILPYGEAKRVDARIRQWADNGTLDELRRDIAAGRAGDVVDLEMPVAVAACKAGLLEPINAASLLPGEDGTAADRDFYKGMIGPCFVASAVYGQTIVCHLPCSERGTSDLFALTRNGIKIGLHKGAKINLELALLMDGVQPNDVYNTLETEPGVARAFAKLQSIKPNIVWWNGANEPIALLRSGQTRITTALTAEAEAATQDSNLAVYGFQLYEADVLAVPKAGARTERAVDYLHYATSSAPLANMVKFAPYAPPRRSSLPLVEKLSPSPLRDFVLAQGKAMDHSFAIDDAWWAAHGPALEARFRAWADAP